MDWSKAKTIIIIAFIITNLLLVSMLLGQDSLGDSTLNTDFIERVEGLIEDSGIELGIEIPTAIPKLNTITVSYEKPDLDQINKRFLKDRGSIEVVGEEKLVKTEDEKIILGEKSIKYFNEDDSVKYSKLDRERALKISQDFLIERDYSIDDLGEPFIREEKNTYEISYSKLYKGIFVEDTYSRFKIDSRGVREFERMWLNVNDESDKEIYIGTAPKSILALVGREEYREKRLVDMSLCYYFDSKMEDVLENPVDSIEGRAVPAWRIEFSDGDKFIIDEY